MMNKTLTILFLAFISSVQAQEALKLKVDLVEITGTEKVYNFITDNFEGIIGWQFTMAFDGTKMSFKEIRNPIHPNQSTANFYEPIPGELRSVWLDPDLEANNYPDSTVLFQLVFDILEPEGAPLCFLESQDYFEFIMDEGSGTISIVEILISDDCYQGFSIFLNTTATEIPSTSPTQLIREVFLSTDGILSFTSNTDQQLHLDVVDINGKVLSSLNAQPIAAGRPTLQCSIVTPGIYLLKVKTEDGTTQVLKVFAN
jgi:hypothetical protein